MILVDGDQTHVRSVTAAKVALRFNALILTAHDVRELSQLTPEQLHAWLTHWQLGFKEPESLGNKQPTCETTGYEITQ